MTHPSFALPEGPILGIETSCDDTAAAVLLGRRVLSSVVASQAEHLPFEGVVPELASRAHVRLIEPVVRQALREANVEWQDLDGVAATYAPGLIGSLVGRAHLRQGGGRCPRHPVHRGEPPGGAPGLGAAERTGDPPPLVGLLASGGHTEIVQAREWHRYTILGSTRDDAAGEAFDKVAILLGLGYPGGPAIDKLARGGDPRAVAFPRAWLEADSLDFSFSGLKTAVRNHVKGAGGAEGLADEARADVAASFQAAVVDVLATKLVRAAERAGVSTVAPGRRGRGQPGPAGAHRSRRARSADGPSPRPNSGTAGTTGPWWGSQARCAWPAGNPPRGTSRRSPRSFRPSFGS